MNKIILIVLIAVSVDVWAEPQTVILDLPTMNCAMCPITVKKVLNKVDGVTRTDVSYEDKQAVISYDDALTNPDTLIEATTNAGYPSLLKRANES